MHHRKLHFFPALMLLVPLHASAQDTAQDTTENPRFRLNPVHPATAHSPFLVVEGPTTVSTSLPWIAANATLDYARSPLILEIDTTETGSRTVALVQNAWVLHANLAAPLTRTIAIDLSWSLAAFQTGQDALVESRTFDSPGGGVGDLRLGAIQRDSLSNHLGYVAGIRFWAPTGNEANYMSDGRFRFEGLAGLTGDFDPLRTACTLFGSPSFMTNKSGERLGAGCAADVLVSRQGTRFGAEVWGAALFVDPDLAMGSILESLITLAQEVGPLRFSLGAGRGFGSSPGTSALRAVAMVGFVPSATTPSEGADRDLDGIPDEMDACPDEAGPPSEDPARHGCPSKDSDGDGIEDHLDACPMEPGSRRDDPKTTGCPDRDNDHIIDKLDPCPDEPAPLYRDGVNLGCPRHARIVGDRFDLSPPLDPLRTSLKGVNAIVLREVAFVLRATPSLKKVAVEVRLTAPDGQNETEAIDLAATRAADIVNKLVELGVERKRLDAVGALSSDKSELRILIVDRVENPGKSRQPNP